MASAAGSTLLVDASSLIYRALFSTPDTVTTPDGTPINAAHGFLGMLAAADHRSRSSFPLLCYR